VRRIRRPGGPSPAATGTARLRRAGPPETIKCISVTQPWATLILLGATRYEARNWSTRYRGPLAIHASGHFPEFAHQLCGEKPIRSALRKAGVWSWFDLPIGALLGTVRLVACRPAKGCRLASVERALADNRRGRWLWHLADPRPLRQPLRMSGRLGIFEIPSSFLVRVC
jgi:hypothetical protein